MKYKKIISLANVIRSKNSGPFELTLDIIFKSKQVYKKIKERDLIDFLFVKRLYNITDDKILKICYFDPANAVKITIARPVSSGAIGDKDVYGAQQHIPLVNAKIPWE